MLSQFAKQHIKMSKGNKKPKPYKPYDYNRSEAIKWVAKKLQVTPEYVRQCDNYPEKTTSDLADEIRKALRLKYAELQKVLS